MPRATDGILLAQKQDRRREIDHRIQVDASALPDYARLVCSLGLCNTVLNKIELLNLVGHRVDGLS